MIAPIGPLIARAVDAVTTAATCAAAVALAAIALTAAITRVAGLAGRIRAQWRVYRAPDLLPPLVLALRAERHASDALAARAIDPRDYPDAPTARAALGDGSAYHTWRAWRTAVDARLLAERTTDAAPARAARAGLPRHW